METEDKLLDSEPESIDPEPIFENEDQRKRFIIIALLSVFILFPLLFLLLFL